jgi:hypothetical protein
MNETDQSSQTYIKLDIDKYVGMLKKRSWQDYVFLGALLLFLIIELLQLSPSIHLAGPIYGGDAYYHFGHIQHIDNGDSIFMSSHLLGEYEHYPWLTHLLIFFFSKLTGLSLLNAALYFPLISTILAGLITYLCGIKIFKNKNIGLILSVLWMSTGISNPTPSSFAYFVMVPFAIYGLSCLKEKKSYIWAGIVYGICGIQHITLFLGANLFLFIDLISQFIQKRITLSDFFKKYLKYFILIFIIGLPIAMLFWYPVLFVYQGETLNPWQEYTGDGAEIGMGDIFTFISSSFFDFSSIKSIMFSILSILGLVLVLINKKYLLPLEVYLIGFIGFIHPLITKPLLGMSFGHYRFSMFSIFGTYLFVALALYYLYIKIGKTEQLKSIMFGLITVFLLFSFLVSINVFSNDQWTEFSRNPGPQTIALLESSEYINENIDLSGVSFISPHGESAFALNALTGAKVVHMRRTHMSPFVEVNQRIADAAVILYGNNTEVRKELVEKYKVKYLFMDDYSYMGMSTCYNNWDLFDLPENADQSYNCLRVSSLEYEDYLVENGLEVKTVNTRLDPASATAPVFDVLIIRPIDTMQFTSLRPVYAYPMDAELPTVALYEIVI